MNHLLLAFDKFWYFTLTHYTCDRINSFPLLVFETLVFLLSALFYTIVMMLFNVIVNKLLRFFISSFMPSYSPNTLFTDTNSSWIIYESNKAL